MEAPKRNDIQRITDLAKKIPHASAEEYGYLQLVFIAEIALQLARLTDAVWKKAS